MSDAIDNVRLHGAPPRDVVLVHGGPGGAGEMAPVARQLAQRFGVVEALQTELSVDGQVEELVATIAAHASAPVRLVGHSWGAWLAMMAAARHPGAVARLILVSSGVFEDRYAREMTGAILDRLSPKDRAEHDRLEKALRNPDVADRGRLQSALFRLMDKTEFFDRDDTPSEAFEIRPGIFERVWPQAAALRTSGALLEIARNVRCPVRVLHGDYDPSPAEGVRGPLAAVIGDLQFEIIKDCGHTPWHERRAKEPFYAALERALT